MGGTNYVYTKSLWERKFCKYLDETEKVRKWGYEKIKIPYLSPVDKKVHTYYPDFIILTEEEGKEQVFIIEVKPNKQTKIPEKKEAIERGEIVKIAIGVFGNPENAAKMVTKIEKAGYKSFS